MSAIFLFEKGAVKKHKFFIFLKGCYFAIGGPIGFSKKRGFATFPEIQPK